jgi:hypothetical protein
MKNIFLFLLASLALASCQPCEQECAFKEGDEIEMIEKSAINNDGQVIEVDRNMDCSCSYTVKYSNMLNFTVTDEFEEFELRAK